MKKSMKTFDAYIIYACLFLATSIYFASLAQLFWFAVLNPSLNMAYIGCLALLTCFASHLVTLDALHNIIETLRNVPDMYCHEKVKNLKYDQQCLFVGHLGHLIHLCYVLIVYPFTYLDPPKVTEHMLILLHPQHLLWILISLPIMFVTTELMSIRLDRFFIDYDYSHHDYV